MLIKKVQRITIFKKKKKMINLYFQSGNIEVLMKYLWSGTDEVE